MDTLKRAKMGYGDAIEKLYKSSLPQVYYVCLTLTNNSEKATAICSELYKKVFGTLDRLSDTTDFTSWMKNAAVVACISVLGKNNPYLLRHIDTTTIPKEEIIHNQPLTTQQTARLFENCLKRMDFPARLATVCYYFNGMTRVQLCKITDLDNDEVDTVLGRAADKIAALSSELEEKGVVAARIDPKALLELLCLEAQLPTIDPKTLYIPIEPIEEVENTIDNKPKGVKISAASYIAVATAIIVAAGVTAWQTGLFGGQKETQPSEIQSTIASTVSVVSSEVPSVNSVSSAQSSSVASSSTASAVSSKATSSAVTPSKEITPAVKPPKAKYITTKAVQYNHAGEKQRTQQFVYSGGKLKTVQTKTDIFTETLNYSWTKNGRKCTITDNKGTVVEIAEYDVNGNPTKRTFTNDTVNFKWIYKYNDKGLIATANYKSKTNGSYSYKYDSENRIKTVKHSVGGDVYTTEYKYYDDGMISSRIETDFDGSQTLYNYVYNHSDMTYSIECSDGSREQGEIAENK